MNLCIWVQMPFDASGMDSLELQLEAFIAARLGHWKEPCEAGCSLLCRLAWNIGLSAGIQGLGHWPSMHSGVSCVQFPFNIYFSTVYFGRIFMLSQFSPDPPSTSLLTQILVFPLEMNKE